MNTNEFNKEFVLYSGEYSLDFKQGSGDPCYGIKAVVCTYKIEEFQKEFEALLAKYSI